MPKQVLKYEGNSFSEYLQALAVVFGTDVINNTVRIPDSMGTGFIRHIDLEEGFGIRYYDFVLHKDFEFNLFYDDDKELIYRVLYILRDDFTSTLTDSDFIIMYTSEVQLKGYIKKGEHFYRIVIIFNAAWLQNNYNEASTRIRKLIESFVVKNKPLIISKKFDDNSLVLAKQLAIGLTNDTLPHIRVKMICIILINGFLNKIVERDEAEIFSDKTIYYDTIINVEKKIMESFKTSLPSPEELAAEFNLSASTLKRHFKIVFGKSIYEYYQEKRLQWGKKQIENGHKNINEIAYELGFMKVNNFSRAFKKQFHFLPRDLKYKKMIL